MLTMHTIDRMIKELNKLFNDRSHIIYVDGSIIDESALGKLRKH